MTQKNLTINGPGANLLTVQRSASAGNFRIFNISGGSVNVFLSGLTIANGLSTGSGGGITTNATLTLSNVAISGNKGLNGGGIFNNSGTLALNGTTVSGNSVSSNVVAGSGGGIFNSGGALFLRDSTVSANSAIGPGGNSDSGGGIITNVGTVSLVNSAITANSGDLGGGLRNVNGGTVNSRNTIIALNTSPSGPDVNGPLTSQGFNLIGNGTGATIAAAGGDQIGTANFPINPSLGPLQNNGGSTNTHALLPGGKAIDAGFSSGPFTDQRGLIRPVDSPDILNPSGGDGSDIGAFEVQADTLPGCNNASAVVISNGNRGAGSLRDVLGFVCAGSTITFDMSKVVSPITLTSGELLINKNLNIQGPGANILTIQHDTSNTSFLIFNFPSAPVTATISGLTIAKGHTDKGGFATSDLAGAQNCNVVTGVASSRCDYETSIGTVKFAAGETSKTTSVFIIDDSYLEGTETFTVSLSNPSGASLGAQSTASVTITDNEIANGVNPIDTAGFFVRLHYLDFLNREPDSSGLNFWTAGGGGRSGPG